MSFYLKLRVPFLKQFTQIWTCPLYCLHNNINKYSTDYVSLWRSMGWEHFNSCLHPSSNTHAINLRLCVTNGCKDNLYFYFPLKRGTVRQRCWPWVYNIPGKLTHYYTTLHRWIGGDKRFLKTLSNLFWTVGSVRLLTD